METGPAWSTHPLNHMFSDLNKIWISFIEVCIGFPPYFPIPIFHIFPLYLSYIPLS
uniref:Uncharacterized protein n=1 Tax=Anguilla anguilla TaxID=7936 RepID=A0A0E9PW94_ANGAN